MPSPEEHTAGTFSGSKMPCNIGSMQNPSAHQSLSTNPNSELSEFTKDNDHFLPKADGTKPSSPVKTSQNNMKPAIVEQLDGEKLQASTAEDKKAHDDEKPSQEPETGSGIDSDAPGYLTSGFFYERFRNRARTVSKLEDRIGKAPKRLKQLSKYTVLMEDRMLALETEVAVLSNKPTPAETQGEAARKMNKPKVAIPELKFMSTNVYMITKGEYIPAMPFAIDVLLDQPYLHQSANGIWRKANQASIANGTTAGDHELANKMARGIRDLPERLRINSRPVNNLLDSFCYWRLDYAMAYPLVLQRPFKILVYNEGPIKEHMAELNAMYDQTTDSVPTEDTVIDLAKSVAVLPPPLNYTGNATEEVVEDRPSPTESNSRYPEQESKESSIWTEEALVDLRCLLNFMDDYLKPVMDALQGSLRSDVRFSELWYLFEPGQLVYVKDKDIPQKVWRVVQTTGGRRCLSLGSRSDRSEAPPEQSVEHRHTDFVLNCYYIDYDGARYGSSFSDFHISKFEDARAIDALPVYPFSIGERYGAVDREGLAKRGREFIKCTQSCHLHYSGRSQIRQPNGEYLCHSSDNDSGRTSRVFPENIDGEVMIDFHTALQRNPEWLPRFLELDPHKLDPQQIDVREVEEDRVQEGLFYERIEHDWRWDMRRRDDFLDDEIQKVQSFYKGYEPSGDDLLLLPDRVFSFVLRSRRWACISLSPDSMGGARLKPITNLKHGWDELELPEGHKDIVQSLIERHFAKEHSGPAGFDVVAEKGKGLIILLHGAPGVGKTSTAECVAQSNQKPLLPITCGDLGLTPKEVESKLESHFQLAQAWDCILLLDEADIFLAQRNNTDLERNALVSGIYALVTNSQFSTSDISSLYILLVFLRVLEYYEGILFLTTNRVGAVDEAFKSRIHMPLYYPWLNEEQTFKIWKSQLRRIRNESKNVIEFDENDLLRYANTLFQNQANSTGAAGRGPRWNGRQIRNAFQSAIAIAEYGTRKGEPARLDVSHFQKVAKASDAFDDYLRRTKKGFSDADMAENDMMRADTYGLQANQSHMAQQQGFSQYDGSPRLPFRRAPKPQMNAPYTQQNMQPMGQPQGYPSMIQPSMQYQQVGGYQQTQPNMQPYGPPQQQPTAFAAVPTPQQWPNTNPQNPSSLQPPLQQQPGYAVPQTGVQLAQAADQMQQPQSGTPEQQQTGAYQPHQSMQGQPMQNPQPQGQGQQVFGTDSSSYGYK